MHVGCSARRRKQKGPPRRAFFMVLRRLWGSRGARGRRHVVLCRCSLLGDACRLGQQLSRVGGDGWPRVIPKACGLLPSDIVKAPLTRTGGWMVAPGIPSELRARGKDWDAVHFDVHLER